MLFNSYEFILFFLPLTIVGYFALNRVNTKTALCFLGIMSLVFYGYNIPRYILLLLVSISVNYVISYMINRMDYTKKRIRQSFLFSGIIFNVGLIFYFKYFNFFMTNINLLLHKEYVISEILLPLGISFFTFQQISYIVDTYKGETKGYTFIEYFVFVTFFPQLVAGPIVLHNEMVPQFRDEAKKRFNDEYMADGIILFSFGLFKKIILADTFGSAVAWGFAHYSIATSGDLFLIMLSYTFQIYFDFSGYCDMAGGIAKMLNIDLPMNFDSPYKALSISDFWKRWHLTLTRFLTRYIYIPLGGNRKGIIRTYFNIMIVFLISGLWHGANWTFVLWGGLHGGLMVCHRFFKKYFSIDNDAVSWGINFVLVNILWLLFRSDSVSLWLELLKRMFTFSDMSMSGTLLNFFVLPELKVIFDIFHINRLDSVKELSAFAFMVVAFVICLCFQSNYRNNGRRSIGIMLASSIALCWSLISLGKESIFLYFNF